MYVLPSDGDEMVLDGSRQSWLPSVVFADMDVGGEVWWWLVAGVEVWWWLVAGVVVGRISVLLSDDMVCELEIDGRGKALLLSVVGDVWWWASWGLPESGEGGRGWSCWRDVLSGGEGFDVFGMGVWECRRGDDLDARVSLWL